MPNTEYNLLLIKSIYHSRNFGVLRKMTTFKPWMDLGGIVIADTSTSKLLYKPFKVNYELKNNNSFHTYIISI